MINKKFFQKTGSDLKAFQKERGLIINRSRDILQAAKETIFATHRQDYAAAAQHLTRAEEILQDLSRTCDKGNRLRFEGSYKAALEEYVEAKFFLQVMQGKKLDEIKIGNIGPEEYIAAWQT
jgi:predicted translin family RNA/ssDNA-binding protein